MLQGLRKASKSPIASVVIGILVLAFALWGIADIFRGGADTVVAQVGQEQVSDFQYDMQMKNQMRQLSSQTQQDVSMEQMKAMGMDRQVLDQIVSRAALDEAGRQLGLVASQQAVIDQTRKTNVFQGADGAFDPNLYMRALQESGLTEQSYIAATGKDIARAQLVNAAVGGIIPPPGLSRLLYDFVTEQRTMEYLVVTPEEAGKVPDPTDADLEAFHKAHSDQFSAPEYRAFDYVMIGTEQVAAGIKITDDELKAEYDTRRANYERPEQRTVEQIVFPSKEEADKAAARIKTPADFAAIANERGLKDADLKLGTFAKTGMDAKLADAVFAVEKGGVTPPVQGPFGWVILRAADVIPGENKSFDDVKEEIRQDLIKTRSAELIRELGDKLEDERGSGASLSEAAMKVDLPVRHIAAADRQGVTPEGGKAEVPTDPAFMTQVFQTESGEESDLFTGEDGQTYAVHVTQITPPAVKPLASVREEVRTAFLADARTNLLKNKVDMFAEQARKDGNLAGIGKALKHAPVTSKPLMRNQTDDVFSAQMMGQLFGAPEGNVMTGPAGRGNGYVIAKVVKVTHSEPDVSAAEYAEYRKTASEQLVDTAIDSFAAAARNRAGVTIHQQTVQRVLGDTPQ
jgi:peptidyl-prolyl cis-trans isomerase D